MWNLFLSPIKGLSCLAVRLGGRGRERERERGRERQRQRERDTHTHTHTEIHVLNNYCSARVERQARVVNGWSKRSAMQSDKDSILILLSMKFLSIRYYMAILPIYLLAPADEESRFAQLLLAPSSGTTPCIAWLLSVRTPERGGGNLLLHSKRALRAGLLTGRRHRWSRAAAALVASGPMQTTAQSCACITLWAHGIYITCGGARLRLTNHHSGVAWSVPRP